MAYHSVGASFLAAWQRARVKRFPRVLSTYIRVLKLRFPSYELVYFEREFLKSFVNYVRMNLAA